MMTEEHEILRSSIRDFAAKSIEPMALDIERSGIGNKTRKSLSAQGFMGATVSADLGGSELDEMGYSILLDEISRVSPSVGADILMVNSYFYPAARESEVGKAAIRKVVSADESATVILNDVLEGFSGAGEIRMEGAAVTGKRNSVMNRNPDMAAVLTKNDSLVLVTEFAGVTPVEYPFGFRGIGMADLEMKTAKSSILLEDRGKTELQKYLDQSDMPVAAMALGITAGCLGKAIEYTKVRQTFGQPLSAYQPVAFTLSELKAEEELLRKALYTKEPNRKEKLMIKIKSLDLAKRASKYALHFHGGYGYFDDFGVEKFYRDSTALASLFSRSIHDLERLSEEVYGEKSGYI